MEDTIVFVATAKENKPVFITDVRDAYRKAKGTVRVPSVLVLPDGKTPKAFEFAVPVLSEGVDVEVRDFVHSYVRAEMYNILTTLGGFRMDFYAGADIGPVLQGIFTALNEDFMIGQPRSKRSGYGRAVNVIDRMLCALHPPAEGKAAPAFRFNMCPASLYPEVPVQQAPSSAIEVFKKATIGMQDKLIVGLDIGGTDIKGAVVSKGQLVAMKEFDWCPENYPVAEEITDPIVLLTRLLRLCALAADGSEAEAIVKPAMSKTASLAVIEDAVTRGEAALGSGGLLPFDAVGLCFPDVVVRNKIVGGEVPKTLGMRNNPKIDYEVEYAKLTALDDRLRELVKPGGVVVDTNDGPMAAFAAAVELAHSADSAQQQRVSRGVFAHTLGTDLGTGLVLGDGHIPEMPMEMYNLIIDLGSYPARAFPASDVRSMNNTNTGLPGTLQRFTSQTGAFRMAVEQFPRTRPDVYAEIKDQGFLVEEGDKLSVPTKPVDQRKPFLEYLMGLPQRPERPCGVDIFERVGEALAVLWQQSEHLLDTGLTQRFLYGRLIKHPAVFELMKAGSCTRAPQLELLAADEGLAFTPLMKALSQHPGCTIAQFGQAIGAVHYANMHLQ